MTVDAPVGAGRSVAENLLLFQGVWQDRLQGYHPNGDPMLVDEYGGTPGPFPYEQLVYIDFDGSRYQQTNVVLRGRPAYVRTFRGSLEDGVLVFDTLGPNAPRTLGVSGGPGVLVYLPERVDHDSLANFTDPDYIRYLGHDQRSRTTTLYRGGRLRRVLTVAGTRISTDPSRRVDVDPRGADGPVHDGEDVTRVYTERGAE